MDCHELFEQSHDEVWMKVCILPAEAVRLPPPVRASHYREDCCGRSSDCRRHLTEPVRVQYGGRAQTPFFDVAVITNSCMATVWLR